MTYFLPDEKKTGGAYVTVKGRAKKLDRLAGQMVLENGTAIALEDICAVSSPV